MSCTFRNEPAADSISCQQPQYGCQGAGYIIWTPHADVRTDSKSCGCGAADSSSSSSELRVTETFLLRSVKFAKWREVHFTNVNQMRTTRICFITLGFWSCICCRSSLCCSTSWSWRFAWVSSSCRRRQRVDEHLWLQRDWTTIKKTLLSLK